MLLGVGGVVLVTLVRGHNKPFTRVLPYTRFTLVVSLSLDYGYLSISRARGCKLLSMTIFSRLH